MLIAPRCNSVSLTDAELAQELGVPVEQVTLARAEVIDLPRAFGYPCSGVAWRS